MYVQTGKTFITTLIAVVLALGGLALLSGGSKRNETSTLAQTTSSGSTPSSQSSSNDSANAANSTSGQMSYEEGYRAGYRDGHQDCSSSSIEETASTASSVRPTTYVRRYSAPRSRVAGTTYYASSQPRRNHSTRNMILRIAAPAAIGAGIGGIVKGGKGAGIGALLGGGGGALYHLMRHSRD